MKTALHKVYALHEVNYTVKILNPAPLIFPTTLNRSNGITKMPSIPFSPPRFSALPPFSLTKRLPSTPTRFASTVSSVRFDWTDALRFGSIYDDEPDLSGFFQRVSVCNRGSVSLSLFCTETPGNFGIFI